MTEEPTQQNKSQSPVRESSPEPQNTNMLNSYDFSKLPILLDSDDKFSKKADEEPLIDVRHLIAIIMGRFPLVIASVVFFVALGCLQVYRTQPEYTSYTKLEYEPTKTRVVDVGSQSTVFYQPFEINTALQLIKSPAIASEVLKVLDAENPNRGAVVELEQPRSPLALTLYYINEARNRVRQLLVSYENPEPTEESDYQARIYSLLNRITVYNITDTKNIMIQSKANNDKEATRITKAFADAFIKSVEQDQQQNFVELQSYIQGQIRDIEAKLQGLEAQRLSLREDPTTRVTEESRDNAVANLGQLSQEMTTLRKELADMTAQKDNFSTETVSVDLFKANPIYQSLTQRKGDLLLERSKLSAGSFDGFDPLKQTQLEIDEVDRQLQTMEDQYFKTLDQQIAVLRDKITSRESLYLEEQAKIDEIDKNLIQYRNLERQIDSTRELADALITNLSGMEVNNPSDSKSVKVVEPATIPMLPTKPNVFRNIAAFTFLGMIFGVAFVLGIHVLDRSVRNPSEVENLLNLANMGFVPYLKPSFLGNIRGKKIVPLIDIKSKGNAAECFRYLRTSLIYSRAKKAPQVIHVTSCLPGEGKSTVSSNLSIFFSESNSRVLLIDADLKRPSLQRIFNISRTPGLADILVGQRTFENCVIPTDYPNLELLPAGTITPNPVTLLESKVMDELLNSLRKQYDVIIVDSAPTHGMADTIVLSNKVDGLLLVVRQGQTPLEVLKATTEKLRSINAPVLGVVYNNTGASSKNLYGYYGNYGYGPKYQYAYRYDPISEDED
ncbi:MAG: polysaccharide biosynthesis tyrosine autokinase [Sumerlaeia bacterium]